MRSTLDRLTEDVGPQAFKFSSERSMNINGMELSLFTLEGRKVYSGQLRFESVISGPDLLKSMERLSFNFSGFWIMSSVSLGLSSAQTGVCDSVHDNAISQILTVSG